MTKVEKYETVITANGDSISLVHTVDLIICISGFTMPYKFFVCDQLSDRFPIIIGLDYLEKYNCSIDFHSGFVSFDNELVMAPLLLTPHASQPLRCENSVTIPPFSEMIVVLHAPYKFNNKQLYVEQSKQLNNLLVAHSVGVCRNNQVPCKVLNFTPHEVFISRGRYVAQCSVIPKTTLLGFLGTASATHATDNYLCTLNAETTLGGDYDPINDLSEDQVWEKTKTLNISISNPALSDYQRLQFAKLILKNQDLFASKVEDIGRCDFIEHDITLIMTRHRLLNEVSGIRLK